MVIAVGEHVLGQVPEVVIRASNLFAGGVGRSREEMCGVISGAAILVGVMRGRLLPTEDDEAVLDWISKFRERFIAYAGSTKCSTIRDPLPDVDKRCKPIILDGVRMLVEMLEEG